MTPLYLFGAACFVAGAGTAATLILRLYAREWEQLEQQRARERERAVAREQALVALQYEHAIVVARERERRGEVSHA